MTETGQVVTRVDRSWIMFNSTREKDKFPGENNCLHAKIRRWKTLKEYTKKWNVKDMSQRLKLEEEFDW